MLQEPFFGAEARALSRHLPLVRKMMAHDRLDRIHFTGNCYEVNMDGKPKRMRGTHSIIRNAFCPTYDYKEIQREVLASAQRKNRKKAEERMKQQMAGPTESEWVGRQRWVATHGGANGAERGTLIHQQLHDYVVMSEGDFAVRWPRLDAYTAAVLQFLVGTLRYKLVFAEYPFFSERLWMGSSIDLVCLTPDMQLELIELKTQYLDAFERSNGVMHGFLRDFLSSNSAKNQALVQLYLTWSTIIMEYDIPCRARIVWVDENFGKEPRVRDAVLPPPLIQQVKMFWPQLVAHVDVKNAKNTGRPAVRRLVNKKDTTKRARRMRKVQLAVREYEKRKAK